MKNLFFISLVILITGCTSNGSLKPDVPSYGEGRKACNFVVGEIMQVVPVIIEADRDGPKSSGAGIGAYIGNQSGKDDSDAERALKTIVGAGIGSAVGEGYAKGQDRKGLQLFVDLGGTQGGISVVQEQSSIVFEVGQEVLVSGFPVEKYNRSCSLRVLPKE